MKAMEMAQYEKSVSNNKTPKQNLEQNIEFMMHQLNILTMRNMRKVFIQFS